MNNQKSYQDFVLRFRNLSSIEKKRFIEEEIFGDPKVSAPSISLEKSVTEHRFSKGRFCPHCNSKHVVRNGVRSDGSQKYKCQKCGKFFGASTKTILSGTHKQYSVWKKYLHCIVEGYSIVKSAKYCGINKNTSFSWRHKILDALCTDMGDQVILDGIIEADETFVAVSYKGSRHLLRPPHKRGGSIHKRGLSKEQVCVYTGVNRNGLSIAKAGNLGFANKQKMHEIFDDRLKPGSYLCTDGLRSYADLAKTNNLNHIPIKGGKARKGIYHIQNLNRYHRGLKDFLNRFNGVSTKYLDHYLAWHNLVNYTGSPEEQKEYTLINFILSTTKSMHNKDVMAKSPVPV